MNSTACFTVDMMYAINLSGLYVQVYITYRAAEFSTSFTGLNPRTAPNMGRG